MSGELTFISLSGGNADESPRLMLATPAGRIREVELTRPELLKVIQSAAKALERLDRAEAEAERPAPPTLTDEPGKVTKLTGPNSVSHPGPY